MDLNCKHNRNHKITKLIDHTQLQCKDSLVLHVIKFYKSRVSRKYNNCHCLRNLKP